MVEGRNRFHQGFSDFHVCTCSHTNIWDKNITCPSWLWVTHSGPHYYLEAGGYVSSVLAGVTYVSSVLSGVTYVSSVLSGVTYVSSVLARVTYEFKTGIVLLIFIIVTVGVAVHTCATAHVWRAKDDFVDPFSPLDVGSGAQGLGTAQRAPPPAEPFSWPCFIFMYAHVDLYI